MRRWIPLWWMLGTLGVWTGCATLGPEEAVRPPASLRDVQTALQDADRQFGRLDNAMRALRDAPADGRVRAGEDFDRAAARVAELAAFLRDEASVMKKRGLSYFGKWESDAAALLDPQRASSLVERRDTLRQQYRSVLQAMQRLDQDYPPLEAGLRDLRALLGSDAMRTDGELDPSHLDRVQQQAAAFRSQLRDALATVRTTGDLLEPR